MRKTKLDWCLGKEKIKLTKPDQELSKKHIKKAKHNLLAAEYNINGGFTDWAVSQAYYATYHALLAILSKNGYHSINHECTITTAEYLIEKGKTSISRNDIAVIRQTEQMTSKDAKALREEFQYRVETSVNEKILRLLLENSKKIVEKVELEGLHKI